MLVIATKVFLAMKQYPNQYRVFKVHLLVLKKIDRGHALEMLENSNSRLWVDKRRPENKILVKSLDWLKSAIYRLLKTKRLVRE